MYIFIVVALMLVLPVASVATDLLAGTQPVDFFGLVGKWFIFWSVGVRLFTAGLRQMFNPSFTAESIFETKDPGAAKVVTELGIANVALGAIGLLSLYFPEWRLPVAVAATLFYGIAGVKHIFNAHRNTFENVATVSDLWIALVMLVFVLSRAFGF